jgi:hypothetical protein
MKKAEPPSDQFITLQQDAKEMETATLVLYVSSAEMARQRGAIEARITHENGWTHEQYLAGIIERVSSDEFRQKFQDAPEDEDVIRLLGEIDRFNKQCEDAVDEEMRHLEAQYTAMPREDLEEAVIDELIKMQADAAWLIEYRKCQVWLGTMQQDKHGERYFQSRAEIELLDPKVLGQLQEAAETLNVADLEGKGSPPSQDS